MSWIGSHKMDPWTTLVRSISPKLNRTPVPNTCIAMGVFTWTNSSSRTGLCSCVDRRVALLWLRTYTDRADFVIRPATDDDYFVLVDRSLPTEHCTCPLFVLPNCSDDFARRSNLRFLRAHYMQCEELRIILITEKHDSSLYFTIGIRCSNFSVQY